MEKAVTAHPPTNEDHSREETEAVSGHGAALQEMVTMPPPRTEKIQAAAHAENAKPGKETTPLADTERLVLDAIRAFELNNATPIDALVALHKWQKELKL